MFAESPSLPTPLGVAVPRWLSPEKAAQYISEDVVQRYANDLRKVVRSSTTGGRDFVGRNLAMLEFRIVLARIVWNFDMQVHREDVPIGEKSWTGQRAYMLWHQDSYHVQLRDVRTSKG
jgi:hypothetical protein